MPLYHHSAKSEVYLICVRLVHTDRHKVCISSRSVVNCHWFANAKLFIERERDEWVNERIFAWMSKSKRINGMNERMSFHRWNTHAFIHATANDRCTHTLTQRHGKRDRLYLCVYELSIVAAAAAALWTVAAVTRKTKCKNNQQIDNLCCR